MLINGLGRAAGGDADASLAVVNVTQGLRYRFRLVSISCDPNFTFYIQGHNFTVIEVDGVNVNPLTVDSIQIYAGQRYSFVVSSEDFLPHLTLMMLMPFTAHRRPGDRQLLDPSHPKHRHSHNRWGHQLSHPAL